MYFHHSVLRAVQDEASKDIRLVNIGDRGLLGIVEAGLRAHYREIVLELDKRLYGNSAEIELATQTHNDEWLERAKIIREHLKLLERFFPDEFNDSCPVVGCSIAYAHSHEPTGPDKESQGGVA